MQKIIGILIFIAVMLTGNAGAEAQRPVRQNTSGVLTASTLVTKSRHINAACQSNLKKIGFTLTSTRKVTLHDTDVENDYEDIVVTGTQKTFSKGGVKVHLYYMPRSNEPSFIEVSFSNRSERDRFLSTFGSLGFRNMGGGTYFAQTGLTVTPNGNLVELGYMP